MTIRRKIAVITGTRAEYGILRPLLEKIRTSEKLELLLLVTGLHLLERYGHTIDEIIADGFEVTASIEMYREELFGSESYHGKALARGITGFTEVFMKYRPEMVVVFGDRLEPLAAALAASMLRLPLVHIHAGDKTDSGHIDESVRFAISRFAHLLLAATQEHANRLIRMGEEPWRVHDVGALGLDSILGLQPLPKSLLYEKYELNENSNLIICLFHPVHLEKEQAGAQMHQIMEAIVELQLQTLVIYPNNDPGSQDIIAEIERYRGISFIKIVPNLPHDEYISMLRHADVLIGNSSSGIIEAPSLKLPVINVGSRNVGRTHAENVIFVDPIKKEIVKALKKALHDEEFLKLVHDCSNPYGDGKTSERIMKILEEIKLDDKLLRKQVTY